MSPSPLGTVPVTSMVLNPSSNPAVNQTTCFAGPPTFNRAIILITLGLRTSDCEELLCIAFDFIACEARVGLALSLRSRRKHKAWGASPRINNKESFEPADAGDSAAARYHGLQNTLSCDPGGCAPGFMLSPASQA